MKLIIAFLVILSLLSVSASPQQRDWEHQAIENYENKVLLQPMERETEEQSNGWRTWNSIKNAFSPVTGWFKQLPSKTPKDVANEATEKVYDVKEWADNNAVIQKAIDLWTPFQNWISTKASELSQKTFGSIYQVTKEAAGRADENFGTWIDDTVGGSNTDQKGY